MTDWTAVFSDLPETYPESGQRVALKYVARRGEEGLFRLIEKISMATFSGTPELNCHFDTGVAIASPGMSEHKALGYLEWTPCEDEDFYELSKSYIDEVMK